MDNNHNIVPPDELRRLSGKKIPSAIHRWAKRQGIKVHDGAEGPWTTVDALNASLGLGAHNHDTAYSPDIL